MPEPNKEKKDSRCGIVAIVGRPNVGKSTLLNKIIGEKIAIVSKVPQTTRHQIRGIYTDERGQIIFIDTPGFLRGKDKLDQFLKQAAVSTFHDADGIIHLVDSSETVGREEEEVVSNLKDLKIPIIVGFNKIDLKGKHLPEYISLWERAKGKPAAEISSLTLLPLSGKRGTNVDKLLDLLFELLPQGPALYPPDIISDLPQKMAVADIIREKLLNIMREEVPHSIAVIIEQFEPRKKNVMYVGAVILVERDSQKEIVIGKGGNVLKTIGILAREELETLLDTSVFLDLHVKLKSNWRDDGPLLQDLGYAPS